MGLPAYLLLSLGINWVGWGIAAALKVWTVARVHARVHACVFMCVCVCVCVCVQMLLSEGRIVGVGVKGGIGAE